MGKTFSNLARRSNQRYNASNRAERALDKQTANENPVVAPKHESTAKMIDEFQQAHPEYLNAQKIKHEGLDARLKGLVVNPEKFGELKSASRPLPMDRSAIEDQEYGYLEPTEVKTGYCTIRQALEYIGNHSQNPIEYTPEKVALEYNLDKVKVKNILKYYHVLQIQFPKNTKAAMLVEEYEASKARIAMPQSSKQIEDKSVSKKESSAEPETEPSLKR